MIELRQRTALVTGVSSGLGRMTADRLVELGWDVLGTVRSSVDCPRFETVRLDVTDDDAVEQLGLTIMKKWGRLDALVNNAGTAALGPVEELNSAELRHNLDVNLVAPIALVRACLPSLRAAGGVAVQVSSVSGYTAYPMFSAYHASKWGLEGATEALLDEVKDQGVRVVIVEPGSFRTEIAAKAPLAAARGHAGFYNAAWAGIEEWLLWHHTGAPDASECVEAIVAAASRTDSPFRIPVGEGAVELLRERAAIYLAAADAAEAFHATISD